MEYEFSIEEMIQRLAEFPPKALREKVTSEIGEMSFNYYHSTVKENIYNYVASLPDREIRALFEKTAKKGTNILKPCCNVCAHAFPSMYEDIPGSHVSGWWMGGCELDKEHREIGSSRFKTSPDWCPLREKGN